SKLFSNLPTYPKNAPKQCLKRYGEHVLVDGPFEVHPAQICSTSMDSVDAILVSNWMSLLALPFFTEETNFTGVVYATDPTLQLGRLVMEELLDFFDRVDREERDHSWKKPALFMSFPNIPTSDPREWRPFYSREQMESCLTKVQRVSFRESVNIHGAATIAAYSSGYSIGSCNWIVQTEHEKLNPSILPDLAPKLLVMPEMYAQPSLISSQRTEFVVNYNARATFRYGDTFMIPSTTKTKRVRLHPDTLRGIELRGHHDQNDIGLSALKGVLSVYDNILELNPDMRAKIRNSLVGKLDPEIFAETLTKMNLKYSQDEINGNIRFTFDTLDAVVYIENGGFRTVIRSPNRENRQLLSEAVAVCLKTL
ncbi:hypothetical protein X798_06853, partial [Onchocerca flexuosa]